VLRFGIDPVVTAAAVSCWSLWLAGWPDQARARALQGCHQAKEMEHRFSLILAVIHAARVHLWCGEVDAAERFAEEGARLAREDGVVEFIRAGDTLLACIRVQRGEPEGGVSLLADMVAQYRSAEIMHLFPLHLSSLADAYWQVGRVEEGLATIAEALRIIDAQAGVFWAAEVYRIKGELLFQQSKTSLEQVQDKPKIRQNKPLTGIKKSKDPNSRLLNPQFQTEAEACFLQAREIARQQEAKSLELRAAMSLSRLWQQQDKRKEARTLLREIYGWFTEGFDTKDLREAKALLDELDG
jgi:tetratricopeptide (TPR) repeat protein